eukprot:TRINITY_DN4234_c0_g2_i1.p1 TRINITY_DN4234_c0_g2~~TRINITY_DN4234_c0_g2_i1.p1  ORF type:complete len:630 (+),score=167.88 TRINITY_DN4234_c0_g2_i1:89-1891(+)
MATCWMEPPAEVLRRRATWASGGQVRVSCAEQFDWGRLERSRHEVYQWSPYLAPDCKPERAWLGPLRWEDPAALGLAGIAEESPAAAAARERMGSQPPATANAAALDKSLRLLPSQHERIVVMPEHRTWRVHHADVVKKAFLTPARLQTPTPEHLKQLLLADRATRLMIPGASASLDAQLPKSEMMQELLKRLPPENKEKLSMLQAADIKKMAKTDLETTLQCLKDLADDSEISMPSSRPGLEELLGQACRIARGEIVLSELLTDQQYLERVENLDEEAIHQLWKARQPLLNTEVFGDELSKKVETALLEELREDEKLEGSAVDELELAVEVVSCLRDLGVQPSKADIQALCAAGHAVDDADLAAKVFRLIAEDLLLEPSEDSGACLGPSGEALSSAMVKGGWERGSVQEFLRGERLLPRRDARGAGSLGSYSTRFLDPLQGIGSDEGREEIQKYLLATEVQNAVRATLAAVDDDDNGDDGDDDDDENAEDKLSLTYEIAQDAGGGSSQLAHISAQHIVEAALKHPTEVSVLLSMGGEGAPGTGAAFKFGSRHKKNKANAAERSRLIYSLGLPMPRLESDLEQLVALTRRVLGTKTTFSA